MIPVMVRKAIAAFLLLVVAAGAEGLMAPMLTMYVALSHPAHAMAQPVAMHHHAMTPWHPCCPGFKATSTSPMLEVAAAGLRCADQHRCCFQQGPQSAPAPVRAREKDSREIAATDSYTSAPTVHSRAPAGVQVASAVSPPAVLMVLRI